MTYTVTNRNACTNDDCCLIGVDPELSPQARGEISVVRLPMFELLFDDQNDYDSRSHDPRHEHCMTSYHYCSFGLPDEELAGYSERMAREFVAAFLLAHPEASPYAGSATLVGA